jgi:hypothetical protein
MRCGTPQSSKTCRKPVTNGQLYVVNASNDVALGIDPTIFRTERLKCSLEFGELGWWGDEFAFGCDCDELVHEVESRDPHVVKPTI